MRFILIYIYIALLSFLPSCFTKAQEAGERIHIYGNITDASTKEALPYASIRIKNSSKGCSSDVNGYFSFHADILHDTLLDYILCNIEILYNIQYRNTFILI